MSFFEDLDEFSLLEHHASSLYKLEREEAQNLLTIYKRASRNLKARLNVLEGVGGEETIRQTLFQVEGVISFIQTKLLEKLPTSIATLARIATNHLLSEMGFFEKRYLKNVIPINVNALRVASKAENFLINRYSSSIAAYSTELRNKIVTGLQDAVAQNVSGETITSKMMEFFGAEEWRLRRIVRTEMHNIYGQSKMFGMEDLKATAFPDLKKTLYNPMDSRTGEDSIFVEKLKLVVDVDEPFRYQWKGKWRVFYAVDRPNDRSIVIPYRPSWG